MWIGLQVHTDRHLLGRVISLRATYFGRGHYRQLYQRHASTKAEELNDSSHSNLDLHHSQFISEASKRDKWNALTKGAKDTKTTSTRPEQDSTDENSPKG